MKAAWRLPGLRAVSIGTSMVFVLLAGTLAYIGTLAADNDRSVAEAQVRRYRSLQLGDQLRQTSHDLSVMARLSVATGAPRYRDYYDRILAIRNGDAPRPEPYDSSFWDRVLDRGDAGVTYGERKSLRTLMQEAGFAPQEFSTFDLSRLYSEQLAQLELAAMDTADRQRASAAVVRQQYARLTDADYFRQKGEIMETLDRFLRLVDQRTGAEIDVLVEHGAELDRWRLVVLALLLAYTLLVAVGVDRLAVRPLRLLLGAAQRFGRGFHQERARVRALHDIEQLAQEFNFMASSIESDFERRERLEGALKAAREQADNANRAKSTFLATMSHEIRTPIIGVTGMLELLSHSRLDAEQQESVGIARQSAAALLQIIGDILDFSKIEAGKMGLSPVTVSLRALVTATLPGFTEAAAGKGVRLAQEVDEAVAPAHVVDPVRLRQILSNFLSNAVKFTREGSIDVALAAEPAEGGSQALELRVTDTGIGVSAENQAKLFAPFTQAETSTTREFGGTGLGLAIARRLAELMGGTIAMRSAPGAGTTMTFRVVLPLGNPAHIVKDEPQAADRRAKPSRERAEADNSVILLAEDHPTSRIVLARQLDLLGVHVDVAPDGAAALEQWRAGRYGLVFTDVHMPRLDGYGLAEAIRAHERDAGRPRTPVVGLTASVLKPERDRCLASGMDEVILKPVTIGRLGRALRRWLPAAQPPSAAPAAEPESPPHAMAAQSAVLDFNLMRALYGSDDGALAGLLAEFRAVSDENFAALGHSLRGRDAGEVARIAHRIRGGSMSIGAAELADVSGRLEAAAGAADWDAIGRAHGELEAAYGRVCREIGKPRAA